MQKIYYSIQIIAIILTIGLLYSIKPVYAYKPCGIICPITEAHDPIAVNQVMVLTHTPANALPLATINLEQKSNSESESIEQQIMTEAKQLSASIGANGLVITDFNFLPKNNEAALARYVLRAKAIAY